MGMHISGTQVGENIRVAALRDNGNAVHHHNFAALFRCLKCPVNGSPNGMTRLFMLCPIVGALDTHNHIRPGVCHGGGNFGIDVLHGLLGGRIVHSLCGNVNKRKDTHLGAVNDVFLEVPKIAPAGGTGIHRSGHTGTEHISLCIDGAQTVCHLVRKYRIDMAVHINQTRCHNQPGHVHNGVGIPGESFAPGGNLAILNAQITRLHCPGAGVIQGTALQKHIILRHLDSLPTYFGIGLQAQKSVPLPRGYYGLAYCVCP